MPTVVALVESVEPVKSGVTNGRAWTMYAVRAAGKEIRTFDGKWTEEVGKITQLTYNEEQKGKFTNYRMVDKKANGATTQTAPRTEGTAPLPSTWAAGGTIVLLERIVELLEAQNILLEKIAGG